MVWLIGFSVVITLLLFSKIVLSVHYSYVKNTHLGSLHIHILKIPIYRKDMHKDEKGKLSLSELFENEYSISEQIKNAKTYLSSIKDTIPNIYWLIKKIHVYKFRWHTNIGAGEASSTGVLCGGVWTLKGLLVSFFSETSNIACPMEIRVLPHFQHKVFHTQVEMKMSIRLFQAIIGGFKILNSVSKHEKMRIKLRERKI